MAIENVYFRTETPVNWRWPLRIGVMDGPEEVLRILEGKYFAYDFCTLSPVERGKAYDIVIVNNFSIADIRAIDELYFQANVILLRTNLALAENAAPFGKTLSKVAQKKKAAGIFLFSTDAASSSWLDNLVLLLANDIDVATALRQNCISGYFLYDVKVEIETRISFLVENVKLQLLLRDRSAFLEQYKDPYDYPVRLGVDVNRRQGVRYKTVDPQALVNWARLMFEEVDRTQPVHRNIDAAAGPLLAYNLPRFLQAKLLSWEENEEITDMLRYQNKYRLKVRIGSSETGWSSTDREFPDVEIFEKKVTLRETILIVFIYGEEALMQSGTLELKRYGNSDEIEFTFLTPGSGELFTGDIYAYHKGRILQKITLEIPYQNIAGKGLQLKETFIARQDMNNLDMRMSFASSFFYDGKAGEADKLTGLAGNEPIHLNHDGLKDLLEDIRDTIEFAITEVEDDGQTPKSKEDIKDPHNVALLVDLALMGNQLYVDHLKRKELTGPLQIVTSRNEFVPLDFVYTFTAPSEQATLCPNALDALQNGACKDCLKDQRAPAPHVCPFGFLGISHIIERHTTEAPSDEKSDYTIKAEPSAGRNVLTILKNTLYASSNRVAALTPGLENDIATCLNSHTNCYRATTWSGWTDTITKEKPDTQIMLVHVESAERRKIRLEIGDELILQQYFEPATIKPGNDDQSPLMIVIGCETTNVENYAFDISNRLINCGAAIVLSNFTKIRGRHAGIILMTLVELLSADPGKEKSLGEIIVRLKQLLLAKGIMASLALVALGDADWKIKK